MDARCPARGNAAITSDLFDDSIEELELSVYILVSSVIMAAADTIF